jgi:putative NADH-flavin reductase
MKLVIFGAAGATGRVLVEQALAKGYEVTAFDRHVAPLETEAFQHPKLTLVKGDIFDQAQVEAAIAGQDAVICVLGVRPGSPAATLPVCSTGTKNMIDAMQKLGVKRYICQSAFVVAALDGERGQTSWLLPLLMEFTPKVKTMFADKVAQERFIRQSNLDWVIVRPAQLREGPKTGTYKAGDPLPIGLRATISYADVADFLLKQVTDDTFLHKTPRLKY